MIKQIKFVSIPVRDQNRALDFYTDKLGFTIITDQPFDEKQRWIDLRIPKRDSRSVFLTPEGPERGTASFINRHFPCIAFENTSTRFKKRGSNFKVPRQNQPGATNRR